MKSLNIGGLEVKVPIVQGGMGVGVSLSGLASAVANEGGLGIISAVGIGMTEPDYKAHYRESNKVALRKEIRKARANTGGALGVNIMLAASDFDSLMSVAIEENIDVVIVGAGLFLQRPVEAENCNTKFIPKVSSGRAANIIFKSWSDKYNKVPDAVVVEGPLSGGHLGFKKTEVANPTITLANLVADTVKVIDIYEQKYGIEIPVIAAGGIYNGKDMLEIMQLGAKGIKMGTKFVTTKECDVSDLFKQNYIQSKIEDITYIDSPVGLPARVITNDFVKSIQAGSQKPVKCPWKCLKTCNYKEVQFCIAEALFNAANGKLEHGFSFAGINAYQAKEILSVKEVFEQMINEYQEALYQIERIAASA